MKPDFILEAASLAQLPAFLAVAERKSFTRAARDLGVSPSAVSQAVARLEAALDVPLFVRTTRSVNLTTEGARLASEVGPALATAGAALRSAAAKSGELDGVLRLNVPQLTCCGVLPPLLAAYRSAHPKVRVEVTVDNQNVDIVAGGFDAGVRLHESVERDMVVTRLSAPIRFMVVGSKRYFAKHGRPKRPSDLLAHQCLGWRSPTSREVYRWEFEQRGRVVDLDLAGPLVSNDTEFLLACAEEDLGLVYAAEPEARDRLARGKLESVLDAFCPEVSGLFLYYPRAARRAPLLSAFVACAREAMHARGANATSRRSRGSSEIARRE